MYVCICTLHKSIFTLILIKFLEKDFRCKQKHHIYELYYLIPFT